MALTRRPPSTSPWRWWGPVMRSCPCFWWSQVMRGRGTSSRCEGSSSVPEVKKMIETKTAVTPEKQIVTCNGKRLEDGKIMADYNIRTGHLLFLTPYCIGGWPPADGVISGAKERISFSLLLTNHNLWWFLKMSEKEVYRKSRFRVGSQTAGYFLTLWFFDSNIID